MTFLKIFKAARRVSAPIVVIKTADQWAAVQTIARSFNGSAPPMLTWNVASGIEALNDAGQRAFAGFGVEAFTTTNPVEALSLALKLPERAILFCYNAQRVVGDTSVSQAVWNTREQFKRDGRTLVLLGPDMPLPPELAADVVEIDEALPSEDDLRAIIAEQISAADLGEKVPSETIEKAINAVTGLAAFPAEQVVAMSLTPDGLDLDGLWERKRQAVEQTPGLSVHRDTATFDDIGGVANAKEFGRALLAGNAPPRVIVFIDEIEKAMSGTAGDTSGVSQEMLGTMLTWMQDRKATGMLLVGPPGAAKSAYAKTLGNTGGLLTIVFDLSGMKGSLVGESGRNLRTALKVVDAVSQGRALVVATCNSIATLPPELRRRFKNGTFFFDLPTATERQAIWKIYEKKFGLTTKQTAANVRPDDDGWTGAEIETCCELAWSLNIALDAAAEYIVPVARSAAESIAKLRETASGRFISASQAGAYNHNPQKLPTSTPKRRYQET